jgi:hypothetical protein
MKPKAAPVPNWRALEDPDKKLQFGLQLENRFSSLSAEHELELQEDYDQFTECVGQTALEVLGPVARTKRQQWAKESTLKLIEERDKARMLLTACSRKDRTRKAKRDEWNRRLTNAVNQALLDNEMQFLEAELQ